MVESYSYLHSKFKMQQSPICNFCVLPTFATLLMHLTGTGLEVDEEGHLHTYTHVYVLKTVMKIRKCG